ncbi:hypothetical protein [Ruminococcus flavefaciens]|uniref:phage tail protein n=1 Tax=Ruminococcus flavefaciens TaxID=1265 RepID=UPI0026F2DD40|nr:hypothetical protein [Ruminococcus flavefaciens]
MAFDGTLKFDTEIVTEGFKAGLEKIGSFAKKGMALVTGSVTAASGAMIALGKSALDAYADYEQLTGGVSTLFGTQDRSLEEYAASVGKSVDAARSEYDKLLQAQSDVLDNAAKAFKTAGLSQNEYMETVTSFSAALIASLGGDTLKAAEVADKAIVDMADNANKMGSSMESIQNAYQGFAKQNYTMLDNLKLGYGGTKSEMERLLADAEAISGVHYDIESYADVVEAIHVIQDEMGITGTTAKEAAETISGSVASMKASWSNLVVGIADDEQDFDKLTNDFVESAATAAENILPRVETILGGMGKLVTSMSGVIADALVGFTEYIPDLIEAGVSLVDALVQGLVENAPALADAAFDAGMQLLDGLFTIGPKLLDLGAQLLTTLIEGVTSHISDIVETAKSFISTITDAIVSNAPALMAAAASMLGALVTGITDCLPDLIDAAISIIVALVKGLYDNLPILVKAIVEAIPVLVNALISSIPQLLNGVTEMIKAIVDYLPELIQILIENLPAIIVAIVEALIEAIPQILEAAVQMFMAIVEAIPEILVALVTGLGELLGKIGEFLKNIIVSIAQWAIEMQEKARQAAKDFLDGVVEFFKDLPHKIGEFIGQAIGNIVSWALEMREKARNAAKDFLDNIVTFFKELPGKIWDNLTAAIKHVIAWGLELREKAKSAASDMFHNIVDTIKELPGKMLETGKNIVEGIWNGIKNMGQWIKDKIFGFADGIIDGFKSAFGINSPSRVMRDSVGKYLAEGVGVGFMEELPNVADEAREALTHLDLGTPKVGIDIVDPAAELPELPPLEVDVPDVELPELKVEVPEIELPKLEIDIPDIPKPDKPDAPTPSIDTDTPKGSAPQPIITNDALTAMTAQQVLIDRSDTAPSATSDIVNNQYTYNNTEISNDSQTSSEPTPIALTAQFIVGEEVVAEGVLDIVDNKIDERQGLRVQMKRRGVTT